MLERGKFSFRFDLIVHSVLLVDAEFWEGSSLKHTVMISQYISHEA